MLRGPISLAVATVSESKWSASQKTQNKGGTVNIKGNAIKVVSLGADNRGTMYLQRIYKQ